MYWTEFWRGVGRVLGSSGVAVNAGSCEAALATGETVNGTRLGVGGRVAVGEAVPVGVGNPEGSGVSFAMRKKGS